MNPRPSWLTTVCVLAIVMGAMGLLLMILATVGLLFADRIQEMSQSFQGQIPGGSQVQLQIEMQKELQSAADKWKLLNIPIVACMFPISIALIVGGVRALRGSPRGRTILVYAFIALAVIETIRLVPQVDMSFKTSAIMERYMAQILAANNPAGGTPPPPQFTRMFKQIMKVSMGMGLALGFGWVFAKIAFCLHSQHYLRRNDIRKLFEPDDDEAPAPGDCPNTLNS